MAPLTLDFDQDTSTEATGNEYDRWKSAAYYAPDFRPIINQQLDRLASLQANWDGEGAEPIDPQIIQVARQLAEGLPGNLVGPPAVVPMAAGNLQFEWNDGARSLELEIEFPTIHYLKWHPEESIEEEGFFAIDDMDRTVLLIRWFTRSVANV